MDAHVVESVGIKKEGIKTSSAEPDEPVGIIHHVENETRRTKPGSLSGGDKSQRLEIKSIHQFYSKAVTSSVRQQLVWKLSCAREPHGCQLIMKRRVGSAFHTRSFRCLLVPQFMLRCEVCGEQTAARRSAARVHSLSLLDHMCLFFLHLFLCLSLQTSFCLCLILQVARYVQPRGCHPKQVGVSPPLRGG